MDRGIVTLSFDDGRRDTYDVFMKILKPMGIPATVNIPSGYVETGFSDYKEIGYNGLMSKRQLDEIAECPLFEIAGHGYMHSNDPDDIRKGIEKLREWYPHIKTWGFASPHSEMNAEEILEHKKFYDELGIRYVRVGRNFGKKSYFKRAESLIAKKFHSNFFFKMCYIDSLNAGKEFVLHAIPVMKDTTLEQIESIIEYTILNRSWCVLEIHSIDEAFSKEYEEIFCWNKNKFIQLCEYLLAKKKEGILEIKNAISRYKAL